MKKKIIGIFVIALMISSAICCFTPTIAASDEENIRVSSGGANTPIVEITIIDGDPEEVKTIDFLLKFPLMFRLYKMEVSDMDFTISYRNDIPKWPLRIFERISYTTFISKLGSEDIYFFNEAHTIEIKGFSGNFIYGGSRPLRQYVAGFIFSGYCEEATIL